MPSLRGLIFSKLLFCWLDLTCLFLVLKIIKVFVWPLCNLYIYRTFFFYFILIFVFLAFHRILSIIILDFIFWSTPIFSNEFLILFTLSILYIDVFFVNLPDTIISWSFTFLWFYSLFSLRFSLSWYFCCSPTVHVVETLHHVVFLHLFLFLFIFIVIFCIFQYFIDFVEIASAIIRRSMHLIIEWWWSVFTALSVGITLRWIHLF